MANSRMASRLTSHLFKVLEPLFVVSGQLIRIEGGRGERPHVDFLEGGGGGETLRKLLLNMKQLELGNIIKRIGV